MPPYAGQYDVDTVGADNGGATEYADVVVVEPTKPVAVVEHDNTDTDSQSGNSSSAGSHFEMLLDFNPCAAMTSAVFKLRNCSHCGNGCTKMRGYIKEMNGEKKVYYHKWCSQLKCWKETHSLQWQHVMRGLQEHINAVQMAKKQQLETEEAARLEQDRLREEEQHLQAEERTRREARQSKEAKCQSKALNKNLFSGFRQQFKAMKASLNCRKSSTAAVLEM